MTGKLTRGVIHGRTIELSEDLGLTEGQEVEVRVEVVPAGTAWGEGLRRCSGAFSVDWAEEDDRIMEVLHRERSASGGSGRDRREATR